MNNKITGKEYPLYKIFSSDFEYYIPSYQRPYAWGEEETETLFDDLYDFFCNETSENYFLGSIVLIKDDVNPKAEVIDGQQRLTTISMLIAVIASKFSEDKRKDYQLYLREPGNIFVGIEAKPRLHLREKDRSFFEKYIQNIDLDSLQKLDPYNLNTEAQRHICQNTKLLMTKVDSVFENDSDKLLAFSKFLVQRCFLVSVSTPSQQSAFRVFSVMNSRGMDLLPIDIIKAQIIGKIDEDDREKYTDIWEELEDQTERAGFNELFMHIRMIYAKTKARKSLLEEFQEYVLPNVSPKELIESVLVPYTDSFQTLRTKDYEASSNSEEVNRYLKWLNKIDNSDWMPCSIQFFAEHKNEPDYILWFVKKLERLAAFMHATSKDINRRIQRYGKVLDEMGTRINHSMSDPLKSVDLTAVEKKEFIDALNSDIYMMTSKRRNYIILRLDSFVSDGAATYDPAVLTIEHVLPQTVASGSQWEEWWPEHEEREKWVHKIANLVPLTREHNSQAQNYDFDVKKKAYFTGRNGTSSYTLTTQVLGINEWTPDILKNRQNNLLHDFCDKWDLQYTEEQLSEELKNSSVAVVNHQNNVQELRKSYWTYALPEIQKANAHNLAFSSVNPSTNNTIRGAYGIGGIYTYCVANTDGARIDFCLEKYDRSENKKLFDYLYNYKNEIEATLGINLSWDRADEYKSSFITYALDDVSIESENDWPQIASFHAEWSDKISSVLLSYIWMQNPKEANSYIIADVCRKWGLKTKGINLCTNKCCKTYTRFTTPEMSAVLPELKGQLSSWNSETHYFYEIWNRSGRELIMKFTINGDNAPDEFRKKCERINLLFREEQLENDWKWLVPFEANKIVIGEDVSENELYLKLDQAFSQIKSYETKVVNIFTEDI